MQKKRILDEIDELIKEARAFQSASPEVDEDGVIIDDFWQENTIASFEAFFEGVCSKLEKYVGFTEKDFKSNIVSVEVLLDNLYEFRDKIDGQKIPQFDYNTAGEFCWLGQCKKLSRGADKYLHALKNTPNGRLDLSNISAKEKDNYRINEREKAVKNLIVRFGVQREEVNQILRYNKLEHWIEYKNVK